MTTYYCKCGKSVDKPTTAATTGNRIPDYGPEHECFGCPYVCKVMTWDPMTQAAAISNHECRMSKSVIYQTSASLSLGDKCVGRIYSLDLDFLRRVRAFADTLDGIEPDRYAFSDRGADYCDDGRYRLTIYPAANNKGIQAKQRLMDEFFNPDGSRKDVSPEDEKALVLATIQNAIRKEEESNPMDETTNQAAEEFRGVRYTDGRGKVYRVSPYDGGKFRTFFGYDWDSGHEVIPCGNLPPCDAAWIAQQMLDDYALKHNLTPVSSPDEQPAPEDDGSQLADDDDGADIEAMDLEDQFDALLEEGDAQDAEDNAAADPDDTDEPPADEMDIPITIDDRPEDSTPPENPGEPLVSEELISLRDDVFDEIMDACDMKINSALKVMLESHQSKFDFTAKITFERVGDRFIITHETGYKFEPINYKNKSVLGAELDIALDADGNPVIPYDREKQLTFADTLTAQESEPLKTTVDGRTGLVESVESGGQLEFDNDASGEDDAEEIAPEDIPEDAAFPCNRIECMFWGMDDDMREICCFDDEDEAEDPDDFAEDIAQAVKGCGCTRETVLEKYRAVQEGE